MLVQEITPAMADTLVNLFEQQDCPASPLAALLASGYTTLRSAEFRLRILVDSWVLNLIIVPSENFAKLVTPTSMPTAKSLAGRTPVDAQRQGLQTSHGRSV